MVMQNSKDKRFGVIGLMAVASRVITTLEGKVDGRFEGFVGECSVCPAAIQVSK